MLRSLGFYVAVALGLLLAWASANPVRPLGLDAPPTAFSAERAMGDVAAMARAPHPIGSAENARVRDLLVGRLRSLGFAVEVWRAPAVLDGATVTGAWPETLVALRPGRDPTLPPVAVMSHYDSVVGSPGAADDAAGVATSLEVARAVAARGPTDRGLAIIVTDGEEAGLFGAKAFFAGHPLARRLAAVVNLEARGSSGPATMFETSADNGGLIRRYARVAPGPEANSMMGFAYAHMPNGTDFTHAKEAGVPGLNIAFIGRPFDYHSATATAANLDRRSLQSMGAQTLGVVDDLLRRGPPDSAPDLVYADLFGQTLLAYPAWAGWLLIVASGGLLVLAVRRLGPGRPRPLEMLRGCGGLLLLTTLAALALRLLGRIAPAGETYYQGRAGAAFGLLLAAMTALAFAYTLGMLANQARGEGRWRVMIMAVVFAALTSLIGGWDLTGAIMAVIVVTLAFVLLRRPIAPTALWGGALFVGLVIAVVLQALAPTTAFLVAWPLLAGTALAAATSLGAEAGRRPTLAIIVVGAVTLAWLGRLASLTFDGLGLDLPELLVAFSTLALLVLAPLAIRAAISTPGRVVAAIFAGGALVCALFIALHGGGSPRTPAPSHVMHLADLTHGAAYRISALRDPDPWTRAALGPAAKQQDIPAMFLRDGWIAPAPAPPGSTPASPTLTPGREGGRAFLRLAAPGAREVRLSLKGVSPEGLTLQGLAVKATPDRDGWLRLRWYAPRGGFTVAFAPPAGGKVNYRLAAVSDGWPAGAAPLPPRPAAVMPWQASDSTAALVEGTLSW